LAFLQWANLLHVLVRSNNITNNHEISRAAPTVEGAVREREDQLQGKRKIPSSTLKELADAGAFQDLPFRCRRGL
jgi:hypothetical protein